MRVDATPGLDPLVANGSRAFPSADFRHLKLAVEGAGGVQASLNFRDAKNDVAGRMLDAKADRSLATRQGSILNPGTSDRADRAATKPVAHGAAGAYGS